jgi:hypothetical protein
MYLGRNEYWASRGQPFSGPSSTGLVTKFYCLRFETPPTWRARSPYLLVYPPGTWWPGYTPRYWAPFFSPLTTRRATVEVFDNASTRDVSVDSFWVSLSLMIRSTVSRPGYLGIKHPSGAYDQISITVRHLRFCWCGVFSLTRGWVCPSQLLLGLANAVILGSESHRTRGHILLFQIREFHFRRLLRLAGLHWRYLAPPPFRPCGAHVGVPFCYRVVLIWFCGYPHYWVVA